jgi:hypothetical protein
VPAPLRQLALDLATAAPAEVSPPSDWCLRWRDGRSRWRHRSEGGFDTARYEAAPLDDRTAKAYVERHHYTRSYVASRLRYGLWDRRGALLGVAVLSVPVRKEVLTGPFPELEPFAESLELGRFLLADRVPANGESWFLGRVFRLAGREGVRGVVSFSDPVARRDAAGRLVFPGHIGGIYQVIWISGRSPRDEYVMAMSSSYSGSGAVWVGVPRPPRRRTEGGCQRGRQARAAWSRTTGASPLTSCPRAW